MSCLTPPLAPACVREAGAVIEAVLLNMGNDGFNDPAISAGEAELPGVHAEAGARCDCGCCSGCGSFS